MRRGSLQHAVTIPGTKGAPNGRKGPARDESPDWEKIAGDVVEELAKVGSQLKHAFDAVASEAQDRFEVEFAKAVAKHPELYQEAKRTLWQIQRTADEAMKAFGMKPKE